MVMGIYLRYFKIPIFSLVSVLKALKVDSIQNIQQYYAIAKKGFYQK